MSIFLVIVGTDSYQTCFAQNINDPINLPPTTNQRIAVTQAPNGELKALPTPPVFEIPINADYSARAAVVGDSTRLADFAGGAFVPSAIPVAGQPFFGAPARADLQATGSAVRIAAASPATADYTASAYAELMLTDASFTAAQAGDTNLSIRQLVGRLNRIRLGISDSAFSDPSAVPETLDLAGPNSRITTYAAGVKGGQGLLSYDFFSDTNEGFKLVTSVEDSNPLVRTAAATDHPFSSYPDFVCSAQYVSGDLEYGKFAELWHLQLGSVFRDLGFERPDSSHEHVFGWGTALSGAYRFSFFDRHEVLDRVMFSVVWGQGISHYLADLNAAPDAGDAVVNSAGTLVSLPVFGVYGGYTHNWSDCLRSTLTLSHVRLDSTELFNPALPSPYETGDFLAINLVHHSVTSAETSGDKRRSFYMGMEYLVGQKTTLNGQSGDAQRLIFEIAVHQ